VQKSVEYEVLDVRVVERFWRDCIGGDGALGDRFGYAWFDYLSIVLVRSFRDAAQLWAREPTRRDGDCMDDG
jgi:hypothetical protein